MTLTYVAYYWLITRRRQRKMPGDSMDALVVRVPDGQSPKQCKEKIPIPSPAPNQALVKLSHAAQNPTDGVSDPPEALAKNQSQLTFHSAII